VHDRNAPPDTGFSTFEDYKKPQRKPRHYRSVRVGMLCCLLVILFLVLMRTFWPLIING
jgi:hypothetical protein